MQLAAGLLANDVRLANLVSLDAVSVVLQKNVLGSAALSAQPALGDPMQIDEEPLHACSIACVDGF